jgi:hypothetical protein
VIRKYSFLFAVVVLLWAPRVQGQAVQSPFTTFGIGEPYGNALIQNQGMGGIGVSQPQFWYLNNQNPALLVYNNITVFSAGFMAESRTISNDTLSERHRAGNLNYLATAFPVKVNKWTTSLGIMPYTTVKYEVNSTGSIYNADTGEVEGTVQEKESGLGGLTQFYWSNGVRLHRNFSIGLKTAYIFGPIETRYNNVVENPRQNSPYIVSIREKITVRDFLLTSGVSYSKDSLGHRKAYRLSIGGTYTFGTQFSADKRTEIKRLSLRETELESDTLLTKDGKLSIPSTFTIGASWSRGGIWTIGTELSYQDWSSFKGFEAEDEGLSQSWRAAIGGEITPDPLAGENYLKRITYRVGLAYEKYPIVVEGNSVKDFGINFGFSLPAGRSSLDLAFKVGKRGDRSENLLQENYFKVYFGITFNDQWFIKRKFD